MSEKRDKQSARTEAEDRFFALRESGYTGPIDQNGNKVESGRPFEILQALRDKT